MGTVHRVAVVSDIHYAGPAEQGRANYEFTGVANPVVRLLFKAYRHFVWMRDGLHKNYLVDRFLAAASGCDWCVANGDFSCDTAFVGVSDDAACESARECLGKLREAFGTRLRATIGDHELGKLSLLGGQGGMRLASWNRTRTELGVTPFWKIELGRSTLLGIASSLVALPVFAPDALASELPEWERLRAAHLEEIRSAFAALQPGQRVILFCHDPTALPFLLEEKAVRTRLAQIEQTVVGHLHTKLVMFKSRILAGMPPIRFLGHTTERLTTSLSRARHWRPFRVRLCPALAGIELLKDGGFYEMRIDAEGAQPVEFIFRPIKP